MEVPRSIFEKGGGGLGEEKEGERRMEVSSYNIYCAVFLC